MTFDEDHPADLPAPSPNPIIRFENVSKSYGTNLILQDISFTINKGEFITMIGLSGSGKTTLMKMINALLIPESGSIFVEGKDIATVNQIELRRNIGYVIQNIGLFPHMTVRKNIEYIPKLFTKPRPIGISPEKLMEIVHLEPELLTRYPDELSGGQKQRVGIARALSISPRILLMDEPFGSVDEITRNHLQAAIREIQKKLEITIVFVTHDINEALCLGSRVVILGDKNIIQFDTPENIVANPKTDFIQKLVCRCPIRTTTQE